MTLGSASHFLEGQPCRVAHECNTGNGNKWDEPFEVWFADGPTLIG